MGLTKFNTHIRTSNIENIDGDCTTRSVGPMPIEYNNFLVKLLLVEPRTKNIFCGTTRRTTY